MIGVGFDPGQTIGFCELEIGGEPISGLWAHWRDGGSFRYGKDLGDRVAALCSNADFVAIEEVCGFPHGKDNYKRAKQLMEAAKMGERIAMAVRLIVKKPVICMTAGRSRTLVVGRNNPDDPTIKIAVRRLIRGVPKSTNVHERDAAIVALAAGWTTPNLGAA